MAERGSGGQVRSFARPFWVALLLTACGGQPERTTPGEQNPAPAATDPVDSEPPAPPTPEAVAQAREVQDACPVSIPEDMACIPGGEFVRGSDDGPDNERPAEQVSVSTFLLETREVTNARYTECVTSGECQRLVPFRGYMSAQQPAVGMRWQDADAFCRRLGRRLPTEAEWEFAASGPEHHRYPWGDEVPDRPCDAAIVRIHAGRGCGRETTWPVGSRPAGPYGLYDMAGNVWEWVADHYSWCFDGCARACGADCRGLDPQGPCGGPSEPCPASLGHRTVRGGSWWYRIERATTTGRRGVPGDNPNPHRFGFRCAKSV